MVIALISKSYEYIETLLSIPTAYDSNDVEVSRKMRRVYVSLLEV